MRTQVRFATVAAVTALAIPGLALAANATDATHTNKTTKAHKAAKSHKAAKRAVTASGTNIRLDAGSSHSYTASGGAVWAADKWFSGGKSYTAASSAVAHIADSSLYRNQRYGTFSYNVGVPNGTYDVRLKLAETWFTSAGKRVFNVTAQGATVLDHLDIAAEVGAGQADDKTFTVTVTDGHVVLGFVPVVQKPMVEGIQITRVSAPSPSPSPSPSTTPSPSPTTDPTATPLPDPSPSPTVDPTPSPSPSPSPTVDPTPSPSPSPAPSTSPVPSSAGMRIAVVPNGSYTAAQLNGFLSSGSGWNVLEAQTPGGVTITDHYNLQNANHVIIAGMRFLKGIHLGSLMTPHNPVDRVVFWYDDIQNQYAGQSSSGQQDSHGIEVSPGSTNVYVVASDVYNAYGDVVRNDGGDLHVIGAREWQAMLVSPDHIDGLQNTSGNVSVTDSVFGTPRGHHPGEVKTYDPNLGGAGVAGQTPHHWGQSNFQNKGDSGYSTLNLNNDWISLVGGRWVVMYDGGAHGAGGSYNNLRLWANDPGNGDKVVVSAGATPSAGSVTVGAPSLSTTPPDDAWRAAHPFDTLGTWLTSTGM